MGRRDDLCITVPSFFRCPISLDVMRSPVSLCTGVTYDRSSIQRWLDGGNNTCPATMQVLHSKDLVPNHTLHRLIQLWSDSLRRRNNLSPGPASGDAPTADSSPTAPAPLSPAQLLPLIEEIQRMSEKALESLAKIASSAAESEEMLKFLAEAEGFVPALVDILAGGVPERRIDLVGEVFRVLDLVAKAYADKEAWARLMLRGDRDCLSSIVLVLKRGSSESRIACVRVLESIAVDADCKLQIAEEDGLLSELLLQIGAENADSSLIEAILSFLLAISAPKRVKSLMVRLGAVQSMAKLLSDPNLSASSAEKVLKLLETVSSCREGRSEICGDPACLGAILGKVLKVSSAATEHAVTVLWSVCYLFRDQRAQEAVARNNGLTKILVVMQSNCSPDVRRMAGELLKIFRVGSKSCVTSYDTKTTHIMPF